LIIELKLKKLSYIPTESLYTVSYFSFNSFGLYLTLKDFSFLIGFFSSLAYSLMPNLIIYLFKPLSFSIITNLILQFSIFFLIFSFEMDLEKGLTHF